MCSGELGASYIPPFTFPKQTRDRKNKQSLNVLGFRCEKPGGTFPPTAFTRSFLARPSLQPTTTLLGVENSRRRSLLLITHSHFPPTPSTPLSSITSFYPASCHSFIISSHFTLVPFAPEQRVHSLAAPPPSSGLGSRAPAYSFTRFHVRLGLVTNEQIANKVGLDTGQSRDIFSAASSSRGVTLNFSISLSNSIRMHANQQLTSLDA